LYSYGRLCKVKGADPLTLNYTAIETAILGYLREITPRDIQPATEADSQLPAKREELAGVEAQLAKIRSQFAKYANVETLAKAADDLEGQKRELEGELEALERMAAVAQSRPLTTTHGLLDALAASDDQSVRLKLRSTIAALIERIWVQPIKVGREVTALVTINFASGASRQLFMRRSKTYHVVSWGNVTFDGGMKLPAKFIPDFLTRHP
jgi:hypothetical protein